MKYELLDSDARFEFRGHKSIYHFCRKFNFQLLISTMNLLPQIPCLAPRISKLDPWNQLLISLIPPT